MNRARIALPILLGVIVALWGCTPPPVASVEKSLEARVTKLEKELKAAQEQVSSLSAQVRVEQSKVKESEKARAGAEKARDEVTLRLKARDEELGRTQSDMLRAQGDLDSVRKGLKDLLGRVDAALIPSKSADASVLVLPAN